jgi:hypothetical protein
MELEDNAAAYCGGLNGSTENRAITVECFLSWCEEVGNSVPRLWDGVLKWAGYWCSVELGEA